MKSEISIKARDNGHFTGHIWHPETDEPAPAVILIQEIFGVNDVMRQTARNLSQAGYVTICPDLFWRQEADVQLTDKTEAEWQRAFDLYNGFDIDLGVADLQSTLTAIRNHPLCNGKVATTGYCLGGQLAWLMAARSDADCNISYYGVGIDSYLAEAAHIKNPLLMHIAEKDRFVPPDAQHKIITALQNIDHVDIHVYAGVDHAFARAGGEHYDQQAAHQANYRTADFLARHLTV